MFNPDRLQAARERRRLTRKALAEAIGIAPLTITRLEQGANPPSPEILGKLISALGYPAEYFHGPDLADINSDNVSFRSLAAASATDRKSSRRAAQLGVVLFEFLFERFSLPTVELPDFGYPVTPQMAAELVRDHWGIGDRPIPRVLHLLEAKGLRILALDEPTMNIDALSFWQNGQPYVFLNGQKSAERQLFDAAHELGHLVLHRGMTIQDTRTAEAEANAFASAFLMPESDVRAHYPRQRSTAAIIRAKARWKVSAMALTHRMHGLGLLTDWQQRSVFMELSRRGFRTGEPGGVPREVSTVWPMLFQQLWQQGITRERLSSLTAIPMDELEKLVNGLTRSEPEMPRTRRNNRLRLVP